ELPQVAVLVGRAAWLLAARGWLTARGIGEEQPGQAGKCPAARVIAARTAVPCRCSAGRVLPCLPRFGHGITLRPHVVILVAARACASLRWGRADVGWQGRPPVLDRVRKSSPISPPASHRFLRGESSHAVGTSGVRLGRCETMVRMPKRLIVLASGEG